MRLLQDWPGASALFEDNELFVTQLYAHQYRLSQFPSRGLVRQQSPHRRGPPGSSSPLVCFLFSATARAGVRSPPAHWHIEAVAQTLACGSNSERATDYHGFVLELLLAAAVQGEAAQGIRLTMRSGPRCAA